MVYITIICTVYVCVSVCVSICVSVCVSVCVIVKEKNPLWLGVDMLNLLPNCTSQKLIVNCQTFRQPVVFIRGGTKQRVARFI